MGGGNSSGTSNTLEGRVADSLDTPQPGVKVVARSLEWIPTSDSTATVGQWIQMTTSTDSAGRFHFLAIAGDAWVVEVFAPNSGYLFPPAVVGAGRSRVDLGTGKIGALGPLVGRILLDSAAAAISGAVSIEGTNHLISLDRKGTFHLEDVPPGSASLMVSGISTAGTFAATSAVLVSGGASRDSVFLRGTSDSTEDYSTWPGLRKAIVDASPTGANIQADLAHVPVMVRLDAGILPTWDLDGSSIRFSDDKGTHLPYEIEYWNPSTRQAAIWVQLDTLNKQSNGHSILLHWGKAGVPLRSSGAAVFDSSDGWLGTWHLSGSSPFDDASGTGRTLVPHGASLVPQPEGGVDMESGSSLVLTDPRIYAMGSVAVSVFARLDSVRSSPAFAFRLGSQNSTTSFNWAMEVRDSSGILEAGFSTRGLSSGPFSPKIDGEIPWSRWTLLGGMFDTLSQRVRLILPDGTSRSTLAYDSSSARTPATQFIVGGGIVGQIDEIRLSRTPTHPEYLRAEWLSWNGVTPFLRWQP
jgi:hypothetical protein